MIKISKNNNYIFKKINLVEGFTPTPNLLNKLNLVWGFTLIETIIYIGVFSFIITSCFISLYSLIQSSNKNQTVAMVQEEGNFLIGKIDYILSQTKNINSPLSAGNILSVDTNNPTINPIIIEINDHNMTIKKGPNGPLILNNSNILISCPLNGCFNHIDSNEIEFSPESIEANIIINTKTLDGLPYTQSFETIKYLRK
jgi:type II secretory pathway pseudopilin PulG